jgi:hypothetical protein
MAAIVRQIGAGQKSRAANFVIRQTAKLMKTMREHP